MPGDKIPPRSTPLLSGHTVVPFAKEEAEKYFANWPGYTTGMVRLQPGGTVMPTPFSLFHDRIMNFKFTDTDVVVATYPKCGTTWMQEVVWTLRNNPGLDHPMTMMPVNMRCPFIEMDSISISDNIKPPGPEHPIMQAFKKVCPQGVPSQGVFLQMAEACPQPRTVKTHLPFSLMPKDMLDKAKVVYVMRNPKDLVVSYLHHCRLLRNHDYVGSIEQFVQNFVDGDLLYGHYDLHLKEALQRKAHPNLLLVSYEDMKAEPLKQLAKLNDFLATGRTTQQLEKIAHFTSFAEMQKRDNVLGAADDECGFFNPDVMKKDGGFFRKGVAGNWKEELSAELATKIDDWTRDKLAGAALQFRYGL